ncbi:MAG TPA: BTAD domain-containing putative transcriptional regulator [Acidimicrobiia bacterium]|nr:BTAD domain-containing putative transcriptional regulator [Acidimicrobiia bacterium]
MEFRILGPVEVVHEGRSLPLGGSRERAVLALLLLSANRVVSAERLAADLWDDAPPDGGLQSLRVFLSRLRKALREAGGDEILVTKSPGYMARVEPAAIDAVCFETLVAEGRELAERGDHERAAAVLRRALGLWRGPALEDVAGAPVARAEAARLDEARLVALEERVEADLAYGRHGELLPELEALTRAHPVRERFWAQRMVALYRSGRQAEALRAYQDLRGILAEELGIEPSVPLVRLEGAILRQEPELLGPSAPPAEAPAGVSVFLFTDIAASTRRWEHDKADMAAALARHDDLLRSAVEDHAGRVFKHTGDGICAAFSAPAAALGAAVTGQRRLLAESWGSTGPLSVRMAVHVGTAEEREGDFFGPTLNRLARLLDLAHGGQVLVSEACRALAAEEPVGGIGLLDLGEHWLRDLSRPERVFQVVHPELPASFPPLRATRRERHNLPVIPSSFVGRQRELDEIAGFLGQANLVTLVGPGGAGKTRLAREVAAEGSESFPDGAFFVDLAPLTEGAQVISRAVASLGIVVDGIEGDASEGGLRRLVEHLQGRQALVVLDNCEHLLDETARLADDVLRSCPRTKLLATSREALKVPGELTWPVPPLSLPDPEGDPLAAAAASDAMALFYDRAAAVDPGFRPGPDNAAAVARICRRLDGIPLALELAAARVRLLSAAELAERLDDRFHLLTGGSRTAVSRHQTLRAALDWGHDLLTEVEQTLFRRLGAFRGSFDLDAAEAIGADGEVVAATDVLDLIGRLVDKSWVSVERAETTRYRLSETIRQYAEEQLRDSGEDDTTRRRHGAFYLGVVTAKRAPLLQSGPWLARLKLEDDNLRAALEWSFSAGENVTALRLGAGLFVYWYLSGQLVEGVARLEQILARTSELRRPARVGALNGLGLLRLQLGDREGAVRLHDEAATLAREIGDVLGQAVGALSAGQLVLSQGEIAQARAYLEEARGIVEHQEGSALLTWVYFALGWVELATGDVGSAETAFRRSLDTAGDSQGAMSQATSDGAALALTAALRGDRPGSLQMASTALDAARTMGMSEVLTMVLTRVTESAVVLGDYDRARRTLVEALQFLSDIGGRGWVAVSLELAAVIRCGTTGISIPVARLLGAAQAIRDVTGESFRFPYQAELLNRLVQEAENTLGPVEFHHECDRGRRLATEEAIALALSQLASQDGEDPLR